MLVPIRILIINIAFNFNVLGTFKAFYYNIIKTGGKSAYLKKKVKKCDA